MQSKNVQMEDDEKLSYKKLEQCNYRSLQKLAKSLGLPSNFKKVYLVELIHAKRYKSETAVHNITRKVALERLQLSKNKREIQRKRMKYTELPSSSNILFSPPIIQTPKRPGHMHLLCSPESSGSLDTHNPKKKLIHTLNQNGLCSDRVLRSFNKKTVKPNYALLSGQEIKPHSTKGTRIEFFTNDGFAKCVYKKHKPNILNSSLKRPLMLNDESHLLSIPTKCQKTLTNLCRLVPDTTPKSIHSTQTLWLRKNDGSIAKLNTIIQERHMVPKPETSFRNSEANTQNVISTISYDNYNNLTECNGNNNYLQINYPNIITENNINNTNLDVCCYQMVRSEQIRLQKFNEMESGRLPTFSEVFSRFNNINRIDYSQPLYVQVSTEYECSQSHPVFSNINQPNKIILETVYNIKNNVSNAPLLQIATKLKTESVYSTPIITTPMVQPSTIVSNEGYISYERSHEVDPRFHEFQQFPEQNATRNYYQAEDFNGSTSSLETLQDLNTVTLPKIVEDALEFISQDGDYMDQITNDNMRVQCIFCSWAGPKIILENHIREEHVEHIERQSASTWSVICSLESISTGALLRVVEHNAALYLFRAVYEDTDCLVATLNSLSIETENKIGSITIYNRISGEPFSWSGEIQPIPPNFVCESNNCLQIELSRLDLLPNSANVRLLNKELVSDSLIRAVIGQPSLADIHLILFVKIFN